MNHKVCDTECNNLGAVHTAYLRPRVPDDYFPYRKENCDRLHVWDWLKLLVLYSHVNMDRI